MIAGIGGVVVLLACLFPWGQTAGIGLPPIRTGTFDGFGIVVFVAAIALLALLALPYAAGDQPIAIDRPISFGLVALVAVVGFALKLLQIWQQNRLARPARALGLWLAGIGLAIVVWGTAEILGEPQSR
jgi:hypothetical protein